MKTPVELNEELVKEAFRLTNFKTEKELIDDLDLDNDALRQNLEELAIINQYLGGSLIHG